MKRKKSLYHYFKNNNRKHSLLMFIDYPENIILETGCHVEIDFTNVSLFKRRASRLNKNIKSFLYKKVTEMNLDASNLIVDLQVPNSVRGIIKISFVSLVVMFPNQYGNSIDLNEPFSCAILDYFEQEISKLARSNIEA